MYRTNCSGLKEDADSVQQTELCFVSVPSSGIRFGNVVGQLLRTGEKETATDRTLK